jgi:hypothetical protein
MSISNADRDELRPDTVLQYFLQLRPFVFANVDVGHCWYMLRCMHGEVSHHEYGSTRQKDAALARVCGLALVALSIIDKIGNNIYLDPEQPAKQRDRWGRVSSQCLRFFAFVSVPSDELRSAVPNRCLDHCRSSVTRRSRRLCGPKPGAKNNDSSRHVIE